jgi:DNA-binding IclR family transcriptional regulator
MKNFDPSPVEPAPGENPVINLDLEQMSLLTGFPRARLQSLLANLEARGLVESFECNETVRYRLKNRHGQLRN